MAKARTVKIGDLGEAIAQELTLYSEDVINNVNKASREAAEELVDKTRGTAPSMTGDYARRITSKMLEKKRTGDETYVWYVRDPDYRLTHLLVHGHATPNGGKTREFSYLEDAMDAVLPDYERAVEEAVRK